MARRRKSRARQAPRWRGRSNLPEIRETSSYAAPSTSWARSSPSGTRSQEADAQVNAARDHGQQQREAEADPQRSAADGKSRQQDNRQPHPAGAEREVADRPLPSFGPGIRRHGRLVGRPLMPRGVGIEQEADAGETPEQRDDLGDQAFPGVHHASRGAKRQNDESRAGDE